MSCQTPYQIVQEPRDLELSQPFRQDYRLPFSVDGLNLAAPGHSATQRFYFGGSELFSIPLADGHFTMSSAQKEQIGLRNACTHEIEIETPDYGVEILFTGLFQFT